MKIETERLILRTFSEADTEDVFEYLREPAVNCFACMRLESLEAARKERALRRKRKAVEDEQPQVPEVLPEGNWMKIDKIKAEPDQTSSEVE